MPMDKLQDVGGDITQMIIYKIRMNTVTLDTCLFIIVLSWL